MSSTYGESLKLSIFGQSHGTAVGMNLDGIPAGYPVDLEELQKFLNRRAPGQNDWSTPRREEDRPEFLGGIVDGCTCGAPITAIIANKNTRSGDYSNLKDRPRPGHADYTAQIKYGGFQDSAGGGHFSGRLTAPLCIAGGLCKQWLKDMGIQISAHILQIGSVRDASYDPVMTQIPDPVQEFPVLDPDVGASMREIIQLARNQQDSIGGIVECAITGLPAGLGEPMFGGVENRISQIIYGVPAVKGISFGAGFAVATMHGSENNDRFTVQNGQILTASNHAGGILGGITTGMPVIFHTAIKPTPSISRPQCSVSLSACEQTQLQVTGRHDPCIVPRAVPVIEAAAAVAIFDLILSNTQTNRRKETWTSRN